MYLPEQQHELHEADMHLKSTNRREAEITAAEFEKACVRDEQKRQAVRHKNMQNCKIVSQQIVAQDAFLKAGCGERGMTKFEKEYNSKAIASSQQRRDAAAKAREKEMTLSDAHRVVSSLMLNQV